MTDKQTALLLRAVRDRAFTARDSLTHWLQANPDAGGREVKDRAHHLMYSLVIDDLDNDIDRLES